MEHVSKLRTVELLHLSLVKLNLCKSERSQLAQFRCGILPLRTETNSYLSENVEERVCYFCTLAERKIKIALITQI